MTSIFDRIRSVTGGTDWLYAMSDLNREMITGRLRVEKGTYRSIVSTLLSIIGGALWWIHASTAFVHLELADDDAALFERFAFYCVSAVVGWSHPTGALCAAVGVMFAIGGAAARGPVVLVISALMLSGGLLWLHFAVVF